MIPAFVALVLVVWPGQSEPPCEISGTISAGGAPVPGAIVTVTREAVPLITTSTAPGGRFSIRNLSPGVYDVRITLLRFATETRRVALTTERCIGNVDVALILGSRGAAPSGVTPPEVPGLGRGPGERASLMRPPASASAAGADADAVGASTLPATFLPAGFSADAAAEAMTTVGNSRNAEGMGPSEAFDAARFGDGPPDGGPGGGPGGGALGGGPGAFGGAFGGPGGPAVGGLEAADPAPSDRRCSAAFATRSAAPRATASAAQRSMRPRSR